MKAKKAVPSERVIFDYRIDGKFSRSYAEGRGGKWEAIPEASYFLDDTPLSDSLFSALTPRLADWLELAHAVYLADRLVLRGTSLKSHAGAIWARRLTIRVAVRERDFWYSLKSDLEEFLSFLTQDSWNFEFTTGDQVRHSERQNYLFSTVPHDSLVMLSSGGLDSLVGAIIHKEENPEKHIVLVSAFTNPRIQKVQSEHAKFIAGENRASVTHVAVGMRLRGWERPKELESTQRSRGFFHLSLGCIAAMAIGGKELRINENGIGALNLPFDRSQIGAQNSRPVNPVTLNKMSLLAGKIGEERFSLVNPFILKTKAEMCVQAISGREMFSHSMSCDRPQRSDDGWHCGTCTSCLLRRMSLNSAGLSPDEDATPYLKDLAKPQSQKYVQMLEKMEWQASRLSTLLAGSEPWSGLSREYPMLARSASSMRLHSAVGNPETALMELLKRHVREWGQFPLRNRLDIQMLEAA